MKRVTGKVIQVERLNNNDFHIDVTWDMDLLEMRCTPTEARDRFPPVSKLDAQFIQEILDSIIVQPITQPTEVMIDWIEQIIADYFTHGPIKAWMTRNRGPKPQYFSIYWLTD